VLAGVWVVYGIDGYVVTSAMDHHAASNPLKEVARQAGAWLVNFNNIPSLWAIPALGVVLPLLTVLTSRAEKGALAFVLFTDAGLHHPDCGYRDVPVHHAVQHDDERQSDHVGCYLQPDDPEPDDFVALVFVPIILIYTAWCYWKMFGRITKEDIESNPLCTK
jgi:cytochrome d ubiquinol oxidase subunit II